MNRVVLLALFSLVVAVTPISDGEGKISGSETIPVEPEKYPFVVSLSSNNEHFCGGFIYNNRFIVTAASCVFEKSASQVQVTLGQISLTLPDPGEQRYQIRAIIIHENYDHATKFNDIALLETSQDIQFNANVNFQYYYKWTNELYASVIGWGAYDESKVVSTRLQEAIVSPPGNCDAFSEDVFDANIMFCWGKPGSDQGRPCKYDEGSPLYEPVTSLTDGFVVGIVSKNLGCGDSEIYETIYTRLSAYYSWLMRNGGPQP